MIKYNVTELNNNLISKLVLKEKINKKILNIIKIMKLNINE